MALVQKSFAVGVRPLQTRCDKPMVLLKGSGFGVHDVYGFDEFAVPLLPSGVALSIEEIKDLSAGDVPDEDDDAWFAAAGDETWTAEDAATWRRIRSYVATHDGGAAGNPDPSNLVGAEVWPAAAALCRWQKTVAHAIRGSAVIELGAGTGVCGLYAAGLKASRVALTDSGRSTLLENLCRRNIEANQHAFAAGATVTLERLEWGTYRLPRERFDWVLASDVIYAHDSHSKLASTIAALLRASDPPPRVIIAHEHRSRDTALGSTVAHWAEADPLLADFLVAAAEQGLVVTPLLSERPKASLRGHFRHWSADLSIVEVELDGSDVPE